MIFYVQFLGGSGSYARPDKRSDEEICSPEGISLENDEPDKR